MPLNELIVHRPSTETYCELTPNSQLPMAPVYRRATDECDISTTGHWDSGISSFNLMVQAWQGHSLHVFVYSPLHIHALVPFPFRV